MTAELPIIGRSTIVTIGGIANVPVKVDTGADSSSVWATGIREAADGLHFQLFGPESPYYTGEELVAQADHYHQMRIVSSTGDREVRYVVDLPITIKGQTFMDGFSLADRLTLSFPILLGCSFLSNRFLVDCAKEIPDELRKELISSKHARRRAVTK